MIYPIVCHMQFAKCHEDIIPIIWGIIPVTQDISFDVIVIT